MWYCVVCKRIGAPEIPKKTLEDANSDSCVQNDAKLNSGFCKAVPVLQ